MGMAGSDRYLNFHPYDDGGLLRIPPHPILLLPYPLFLSQLILGILCETNRGTPVYWTKKFYFTNTKKNYTVTYTCYQKNIFTQTNNIYTSSDLAKASWYINLLLGDYSEVPMPTTVTFVWELLGYSAEMNLYIFCAQDHPILNCIHIYRVRTGWAMPLASYAIWHELSSTRRWPFLLVRIFYLVQQGLLQLTSKKTKKTFPTQFNEGFPNVHYFIAT